MRNRLLVGTLALAIATGLAAPAWLGAQAASGAKAAGTAQAARKDAKASAATAENKPYKAPRSASGQPDLEGIWTNLSFTPMVRPAKYGNREFLTKEEEDAEFKAGVAKSFDSTLGNAADAPFYDATTYALDAWQNGIQPNPRTSLIVDPPNGQFPPLTPEAARRRAARPLPTGNIPAKLDTAADAGLGVRCFTFGGPPVLPSVSNSDLEITQNSDTVLLEWEWDSTPRIVSLDGRPHLSSNIRRWNGDSRGHWQGDTLVVETTNFRPGSTYQGANADTLKITEYFTRINPTTIEYKFTIDDPSTWTMPWTAIIPMSKIKGPMPEFACSEGNFALVEMLAAARAAEKASPKVGTPVSQK